MENMQGYVPGMRKSPTNWTKVDGISMIYIRDHIPSHTYIQMSNQALLESKETKDMAALLTSATPF